MSLLDGSGNTKNWFVFFSCECNTVECIIQLNLITIKKRKKMVHEKKLLGPRIAFIYYKLKLFVCIFGFNNL